MYLCILTLLNRSKDKFVTFPIVMVNCVCDLIIKNDIIRLFLEFDSYQNELYAASPILLLC